LLEKPFQGIFFPENAGVKPIPITPGPLPACGEREGEEETSRYRKQNYFLYRRIEGKKK
jgi:hypothetical protein